MISEMSLTNCSPLEGELAKRGQYPQLSRWGMIAQTSLALTGKQIPP